MSVSWTGLRQRKGVRTWLSSLRREIERMLYCVLDYWHAQPDPDFSL
jgi:ATP/maltotriose-dependent transcriptional regulator MalT